MQLQWKVAPAAPPPRVPGVQYQARTRTAPRAPEESPRGVVLTAPVLLHTPFIPARRRLSNNAALAKLEPNTFRGLATKPGSTMNYVYVWMPLVAA